MRSLPAGRPSTQTVSPIPNPIATPAQRSANSTVWWWKNPLNPPPSQSQRRDAPARRSFYQTSGGRAAGRSGLPAGAKPRALPEEPGRDGSRHANGAVAVAERHPQRRPPLADDEIYQGAVGQLLAWSRGLGDHTASPHRSRK